MNAATGADLCGACGGEYFPERKGQKTCSTSCALDYVRQQRAEEEKREARRAARELRREEARRRKGSHGQDGRYKQAREAVNGFCRVRDHDSPCIVHGHQCSSMKFDGGHFIGVEVCSSLRFNTWNIHKQCSASNAGARFRKKTRDTTGPKFEKNLRARIGDDRVDWLKGPHEPREYSDAYLARVASIFRRRTKIYLRNREKRDARKNGGSGFE